jgi:hypothetical protein
MPERLSHIATETAKHLMASGLNHGEVADKLGVCRQTTWRLSKKYKQDIEQLTLQLVDQTIPLIHENHINTMRLANGLLKCDENSPQIAAAIVQSGLDPKDIISISDKKEYRMMQVMGIVPSNTPSVILNQILGNVSVNLVDPGVRQLLGGQLDQLEDIQDAEIVE